MTTTQRPIGRADTVPTAAQKVVAAMWALGKPATTKAIAEAAGVGYSTVTPILRNLLTENQAVKTDDAAGPSQWQLTATLPTPTAGEAQAPTPINPQPAPLADTADATTHDPQDPDDPDDPDDDSEPSNQPDSSHPADTREAVGPSKQDTGEPAFDTRSGSDDTNTNTNTERASAPDPSTAADTAPQASQDPEEQRTARTYRKPVQPRRPKGELRAAVLAVLTRAPDEPFKVSEVCKAIDAANTDGTSNKAGAGAVVNALDKLVTSGDAIRIENAAVATYQAASARG